MTRDELVKLPLKLLTHCTGEYESQRTARNDEHGIILRIVTPRLGKQWGEGRKTFYLDGCATPFTSTDALPEAVNNRGKLTGDNATPKG